MANLQKKNMSAAKFIHDGVKKDLDRRHGSKFGFQNVSYDNWARMFPDTKPCEVRDTCHEESCEPCMEKDMKKQDTIDIMKKAYGLVRRALDFSFKTRQDGYNLIVEEELNTTQLHTLFRVWYEQKDVPYIMLIRTRDMDRSFGQKEAVELLEEIIALNDEERKLFSEEYFNYREAALEKCNKRLY
jgi:hypothetical protein